ncbi:MAG: hypothetical protein ACM674_05235 [Bacteroidales bacterium]
MGWRKQKSWSCFALLRANSLFLTQDEIAEKAMLDETDEKTAAGRVAPISACVLNQIDRLKSKFEAM